MSIPTTKQRNAFPGDRAVVFQSPATDVNGEEWPAGTELTPEAGGYDNTLGVPYQSYTNGGRPLKSGEPRKQWAQRLPVSTIETIQRIASDRGISQSDVVSLAVSRLSDSEA